MAAMDFDALLDTFREVAQINTVLDDDILTKMRTSQDNDCGEGRALNRAVDQYSKDRPRRRVTTVSTNQSPILYTYDLTLIVTALISPPDGWSDDHRILKIQHPIDSDFTGGASQYQGEIFIDPGDWVETIDAANEHPMLRFKRNAPSTNFALWWMEPHQWDLSKKKTTIPRSDTTVLAYAAAEQLMIMLANRAVMFSEDPSMKADGVDYKSITDRANGQAGKMKGKYDEIMGKKNTVFTPTFVQNDFPSPTGYRPFHPPQRY